MAFDSTRYKNKYDAEHYHVVRVLVPKDRKEDIKRLAERNGTTVSRLFADSVERVHGIDLSTGK